MMKNTSRTRKVIRNVFAATIKEAVILICGLVLPRLILSNYGSTYNGITQSITQFISYISLMQAGIGGATIANLYKPIAEKDDKEISKILYSTEKYMRKISLFFVIFVIIFSSIYPLIIKDFDWLFTATLVFIISISTFVQYYFGFTYQCLLSADQKGYIINYLQLITTVLNTIVAVLLINNNFSIHIVKLGSALVSIISPLFFYYYCRKKYNLIKIKDDEDKIPQKWDAAAHEVASFVNNNTDIVILTLFTNLLEVSVYTVYHYVVANIKKIVTNFTVGFSAAFGDMYAKKEIDLMNKNLGIFELIIYSLTSVFCSVSLAMIIPFVMIYTSGINDVNYNRPVFAAVIVIACAFNCFRVPYRGIVYAVGHYKQTKNGAIFEAILNITLSVLMVIKFGLVGVAIGTLCAMAFRSCQYAYYLSKNIMYRDIKYFIKHVVLCLVIIVLIPLIAKLYLPVIDNWFEWIVYAIITTIISIIVTMFINIVFYKEDLKNTIYKLIKR